MEYKKIDLNIDYKKLGLDNIDYKPCLECYLPSREIYEEMKEPHRRSPAMVVLPGGGYGMTSSREHEAIVFQYLAAGFTVFSIRYSVKPAVFPRALYEVYTAIAIIRKNADKWMIDPDKISVCGFSAGGHLTASVGAYWNEEFVKKDLGFTDEHKPNALVLSYPVITAGEFAHKGSFRNLLGKEELSPEDIEYFSIENRVTSDFPRSFIWHTTTDPVVPVMNSLLLGEALAKNKIMFEMHIYPKGPHGLSLSNHITSKEDACPPKKVTAWVKDSIDFLNDYAYND